MFMNEKGAIKAEVQPEVPSLQEQLIALETFLKTSDSRALTSRILRVKWMEIRAILPQFTVEQQAAKAALIKAWDKLELIIQNLVLTENCKTPDFYRKLRLCQQHVSKANQLLAALEDSQEPERPSEFSRPKKGTANHDQTNNE